MKLVFRSYRTRNRINKRRPDDRTSQLAVHSKSDPDEETTTVVADLSGAPQVRFMSSAIEERQTCVIVSMENDLGAANTKANLCWAFGNVFTSVRS